MPHNLRRMLLSLALLGLALVRRLSRRQSYQRRGGKNHSTVVIDRLEDEED